MNRQRYLIGQFKKWLEDMITGLSWMGGEVRINGHKVETCHIRDIGEHLSKYLPHVERVFGANMTEITRCFERHPWSPKPT